MFYVSIFTLSLLLNFFSLWIVTKKLNLSVKVLWQNPAFLIRDFILIPLYFVTVFPYLNFDNQNLLLLTLLSMVITLFLGYYFKLLKLIWLFHGFVGWVIIFCLLLYLDSIRARTEFSLKEYIPVIILFIHQILGIVYPKTLTHSLTL